MKAFVECIPCIIKQGLNTAKLSTSDEKIQRQVVDQIMNEFQGRVLDKSPAVHSNIAYRLARELTGIADPYHDLKKEYNNIVLDMYPELQKSIDQSKDPLHTAIKMALAGNIIDFGIDNSFDLKKDIEHILENELARDAYAEFRKDFEKARDILYLGDNAGEIVFDKLLVEELLKIRPEVKITFVVKEGPIINDAIKEDAFEIGLDKITKVITTGADYIGVDWDRTSDEFKSAFKQADLIISKGQGNYECLNESKENIYFILKAKCPSVARHLKVDYLDTVFIRSKQGE